MLDGPLTVTVGWETWGSRTSRFGGTLTSLTFTGTTLLWMLSMWIWIRSGLQPRTRIRSSTGTTVTATEIVPAVGSIPVRLAVAEKLVLSTRTFGSLAR